MTNGGDHMMQLTGLRSFRGLSPELVQAFSEAGETTEYPRDAIILNEGDIVDRFHVVLAGRVAIYRGGVEINHLERGDTFGQLSLMASLPFLTTIKVRHDAQIFSAPRELFLRALAECPAFAAEIFTSTAARLSAIDRGSIPAHPLIVAVHSAPEGVGKTRFAVNLAAAAASETKGRVLLLDVAAERSRLMNWLNVRGLPLVSLKEVDVLGTDIAAEHGRRDQAGFEILRVSHHPDRADDAEGVAPLLSGLSKTHRCIILDLPPVLNETTWNFLRHADVRIVMTSPDPAHLEQTNMLTETMKETDMIVVARSSADDRRTRLAIEERLGRAVDEFLPETEAIGGISVLEDPRSAFARPIRRIARRLFGTRIGLALSAGVARGFAHVGVLSVLEEEGIIPDVIAGTSVGALIGGLWANNWDAKRIEKIALASRREDFFSLRDLAFPPSSSLLRGRRVDAVIRKLFGETRFEDLAIPLKVVATDIDTADEVILDRGRLADAIRASAAIPGIFSPHVIDGRRLMDGAVLSPVPVAVLKRMGINRIIAVNVIPSPESIRSVPRGRIAALPSGLLARLFNTGNGSMTSLFDIIMRANQYMSGTRADELSENGTVVIRPWRPDLHWLGFEEVVRFIRTGVEAAQARSAALRALREPTP